MIAATAAVLSIISAVVIYKRRVSALRRQAILVTQRRSGRRR